MSLFRDYFKKTLRFKLIWKPGPLSQMAEGGAEALDQAREDALWLREQFLPEICEPEYLKNFARSRGIKRYSRETDEQYKARVVLAFTWQLLGGRHAGLIKLLEYYGYKGIKVVNLRDEDPLRWAEFRVDTQPAEGQGFMEDDFYILDWLINDQKPARSLLAQLRMLLTTGSPVPRIKTGIQYGELITVYPWNISEIIQLSPLYAAMTYQAVETTTIYPL